MSVLTRYELLEESSGDYKTSITNFYKAINMYGLPYAVIHRVAPKGLQSTLIFFDRAVVELLGLSLYTEKEAKKQDRMEMVGLKELLSKIPFLSPHIEGNCLKTMLTESMMKDVNDKELNSMINFIFHVPEDPDLCPIDYPREGSARTQMEEYLFQLSEDEQSIIVDFEETLS